MTPPETRNAELGARNPDAPEGASSSPSATPDSPAFRVLCSAFLEGPPAVVAARVLVAALAVALGWQVARYWSAAPEGADRFLIPLASVWLVRRMWDDLVRVPARPTAWGVLLLLPALAVFPAVAFLLPQSGPRPVLLWPATAAWVCAAAGLVLLEAGGRRLRMLAFPLLFLFFTLPTPDRLMVPLQQFLKEGTTRIAVSVLPVIGIEVERVGFVLRLPSGELGMADACSGVRSVSALAAIAVLVAYLRGFGLARGALLLVLGMPLVAVSNSVRVIISGILQETLGGWAVQGAYHEALGIVVVVVGLGLILLTARVIGPEEGGEPGAGGAEPKNAGAAPTPPTPRPPRVAAWAGAVLLALASAATVGGAYAGRQTLAEQAQDAPLTEVAKGFGQWAGEDLPVPEYVTEMLTPDLIQRRVYRNAIGHEVHTWVIFWTANTAVRGYHHPDVCWPNRGWEKTGSRTDPLELAGGASLPLTVRRFERAGDRQLVCYWTQEGNRVWTDAEEKAALALAGSEHGWVWDRLKGRSVESARLVVLVGADLWGRGDFAERAVLDFCKQFAGEVYRAVPWARPGPPAGNDPAGR